MRTVLLFLGLLGLVTAIAVCQQPPSGKKTEPAWHVKRSAPVDNSTVAELRKDAEATIRWDQSSTPGMKADPELLKKSDVNGHAMVEYHLKVTGASLTKRYTLIAWPINFPNSIFMMDGLAVAKDGTVGCPKDSYGTCVQRFKGQELRLTYSPGLGEIYRHALISDDKQSKVFFSFVPFPLLEKDKGCSLEVVELKPGFGLVLLRGSGFRPGEAIRFHAQSYQDIHNASIKADAHGRFEAPYTPWVAGHTTGQSNVSATAGSCAPKISFNWGAGQ
ncbi:MAG: hypothetical protein ACM3SW_09760 [Actinomycetota bacterium]